MDMDRWRRGGPLLGPTNRPEDAGLERLKLGRGSMPCETPEAPLGQEGGGTAAAGIERAEASC